MSNAPETNPQPPPPPDVEVTLTITLAPALSTKELGDFVHRAKAAGQSLPERLITLIRRDLTAA